MKKWIPTVLILGGVVFCLPYIASIPPFKQMVLRIAEKKLDAKINVDKLRLSWLGPQRGVGVKFQTPDLDGTFEEVDVHSPLWNIGNRFTILGGHIQAPHAQASLDNIHAEIVGSTIDATGITNTDQGSGKFSIQGTAASKNDFSFTFDLTQMPTAIVEWILKAKGMLEPMIGPNFDLKGFASSKNESGAIDFDLTSPTARVAVGAELAQDSITLKKPLNATFYLTPDMSLALTRHKVAVTGQDPITLNISPNNCYIPRPFSLDKVKIVRGKLSVGRIRLQQADYLSGLSIFLKTNKLDTEQVDVWLGRIDFSLDHGKLDLARVDALFANSIHLCAWGQTNVLKQTLDMTLGVPADTLSKSFSIRNVSSKYVLQIPMTGTYQNPQLDTASATAKIAAIVAAGSVQKQGGVLGGVAGIVNQAAQEKSPPPVSPYPPFPWDK